jgi:hypothetical protein
MFLKKLGLRIQSETAGYVLKQLYPDKPSVQPFPVIGADARTGLPVRRMVDPAILET